VLSKDFSVPITAAYLKFNPATQGLEPATQALFQVSLPWLIAIFFFLSATAHFFVATIYRRRYEDNLAKGINKARWIEYGASASLMMVAIAMLVGVYDAGSLLAIFALIAVMNLCGLIMEVHNLTTKRTNWLSYWICCLAGAVPWVIIGLYFWAGAHNGSTPPTFVYWIYVSIFLFFSCFALNMVLQYKKIGPWRDYLYGERAYIILSLVAKSLLAWQVFAGTLRPK
jgi:VanZ family protein